jgi:murein DD-endopeptidase MepM/ murein hydrolase activator NlpD
MTLSRFLAATLFLLPLASEARTTVQNRRIERNQTMARALYAAGLEGSHVEAVLSSLQTVFDCRKSRAGDQLRLVYRDSVLEAIDYRQGPLDEVQVRRDGDKLVASKRVVEFENKVERISLNISSSLYEAAKAAGEDPVIAMALSDVFAWDLDFYRDVQPGDRAEAVVEKVVSKGRIVRYGEVLAASYKGSSVGNKRIFRYELPSGERTYFQEDGSSARKTFLKSPLKYAHVTSGFGSRFHPVLQYVKNHNGVDYGTPIGTPVWSVADGTVTRAGFERGGGNTVCVRHANSMETCYLHLSRFGEGVRTGSRVSQKQIIAFSGNTGMSTGPHLHFALKRGGAYVNPLNQNFPRADPLPRELKADFAEKIAPYASQLTIDSAVAAASGRRSSPVARQ